MALELREKIAPLSEGEGAGEATSERGEIERDVISALLNLGCTRDAAEKGIRKAFEQGAPLEFEPLFRRALDLMGR
jgi:Holliday junction DNA helicase RuvA